MFMKKHKMVATQKMKIFYLRLLEHFMSFT